MQNNWNYPFQRAKTKKNLKKEPKESVEHQEEDQNIHDESGRRRREKGAQRILSIIMGETFVYLMKDGNLHIPRSFKYNKFKKFTQGIF